MLILREVEMKPTRVNDLKVGDVVDGHGLVWDQSRDAQGCHAEIVFKFGTDELGFVLKALDIDDYVRVVG